VIESRPSVLLAGSIEERGYQQTIARECLKRNTLVVLPTGLGKTVIALMVLAERLRANPGKCLFLAPTKPLVEQHMEFLSSRLDGIKTVAMTGETPTVKRGKLWESADVIVATPQVVENDLLSKRAKLKDVTLIVFDEAHRAVGDYAYVYIAEQYKRQTIHGLVLGMTASPGANPEKIRELCRVLDIKGVEVRTEADADIAPHLHGIDVTWVDVPLPENLRVIAEHVRKAMARPISELRSASVIKGARPPIRDLLLAQTTLLKRIKEAGPDGDSRAYSLLSAQAAALKLSHALELVETQGLRSFTSYVEKLAGDESKAAKTILADPDLRRAVVLARDSKVEHPKLRRVAIILSRQFASNPGSLVIVFTQFRETAELLHQELSKVEGIRPARFVGQGTRANDRGLSQAQQSAIIADFKKGVHNTLIATSVAEEGLDIPATDLVVFYEPVPSEIRSIQRRGRTGRARAGKVLILVTKGTRDEVSRWSGRNKERRMSAEVESLRRYLEHVNSSWRQSLDDVAPPEAAVAEGASDGPRLEVIVDSRELASAVAKELSRQGLDLKVQQIEVGDFIVSDRVAVERKEANDFVDSLLDGRLFTQARALRSNYEAPIMIIEGDGLFTARKVEPAAIYGAIAALLSGFQVTVVQSKDTRETASIVAALARREQQDEKRPLSMRAEKPVMTPDEELQFIVEGIPGVRATLARRLLTRFGTVAAVVEATAEELAEVDGIGDHTAKRIHDALHRRYGG
jgi:Fanconi anemia group M protein